MKLSQQAWDKTADVIRAIQAHPFNQELMAGTLSRETFEYYIEQDAHYLQDFCRSHALIAARVMPEYIGAFLRFAEFALIAEQEMVHAFFKKNVAFKNSGCRTPALLSYTSYLLRTCSNEPVEVAIAAVLPCFWVYREVGLHIVQHATQADHPYATWINTYSGDEFATAVREAIDIMDAVADTTSATVRQKMLDAFYVSTCLELKFWDDAYHRRQIESVCGLV